MLFALLGFCSPFPFEFTFLFHLPYLYLKKDVSFEYYIQLHNSLKIPLFLH